MARVGRQVNRGDLVIRYLAADWIAMPVQSARDREPFGGRRGGDEPYDSLVVAKRFATPVRGNKGEQAVLDLVPLAGPRRKGHTIMDKPTVCANRCNSIFHSRRR